VKRPLNQNQWDALVSFVYNVGAGNFISSTMLKLLNQGDYKGAAGEFPKWVHTNGQINPGLVRRRAAERALFET
jgi:lysozyme